LLSNQFCILVVSHSSRNNGVIDFVLSFCAAEKQQLLSSTSDFGFSDPASAHQFPRKISLPPVEARLSFALPFHAQCVDSVCCFSCLIWFAVAPRDFSCSLVSCRTKGTEGISHAQRWLSSLLGFPRFGLVCFAFLARRHERRQDLCFLLSLAPSALISGLMRSGFVLVAWI
jgi:hypothetical protein